MAPSLKGGWGEAWGLSLKAAAVWRRGCVRMEEVCAPGHDAHVRVRGHEQQAGRPTRLRANGAGVLVCCLN